MARPKKAEEDRVEMLLIKIDRALRSEIDEYCKKNGEALSSFARRVMLRAVRKGE